MAVRTGRPTTTAGLYRWDGIAVNPRMPPLDAAP